MNTKQDWDELAISSQYLTAIAVQQRLQAGEMMEAREGLEALIEAMGRSEKRAVKSQLIRLMIHVIKWQFQPERRSSSWVITIRSARREIEDSQEEMPSLNRDYIESIWQKCFKAARRDAEIEMGKKCELTSLSWEEVFESEYNLLIQD